ncbi:MAG TPA: ABC transporter ATP-binding protein [Candidatus Avilachnospira avicola]|nr:ABC transporter ATP-binding protein [Candidatus Avilachnospira avicola]
MIQFENVSKKYRGTDAEVVKDINFTIPSGQIVVLIGPSGCGKTTCLKMINRLVKISSGKIYIDGKDIMDQDPIELRRNMGYVIQQTGLFPHMTVRENIEVIPRLQKKDPEEIDKRTEKLMKMVGLDSDQYLDRYPTQLSGGQLQRVGVARAFATDPDIILMDEPFSALDPITRSQLQDELLFLQSKLKKTIVFVTHDMDEAVKIADRICIINGGRIVQYDTPEEIMKHPANEYVADFVGKNRIWANPEYIRAEDIMLPDPLAVPQTLSALHAIEQMREKHVTSAMVLDDDEKLIGYVRATDIQRAADKNVSVSALMKDCVVTVVPEDDLVKLLDLINKNDVQALPVVNRWGRLEGLITNSSLVTTMSRQYIDLEKEVSA